jgi:hypothetical protein
VLNTVRVNGSVEKKVFVTLSTALLRKASKIDLSITPLRLHVPFSVARLPRDDLSVKKMLSKPYCNDCCEYCDACNGDLPNHTVLCFRAPFSKPNLTVTFKSQKARTEHSENVAEPIQSFPICISNVIVLLKT